MRKLRYLLQIAGVTTLLGLVALSFLTVQIPATNANSDRPTLTPIPRPTLDVEETFSGEIIGAYIELHIEPDHLIYWTEVQWQDVIGNWHQVEGWRGTSMEGVTRWFLGEKDFGTGPFRWLVYQQEDGELLVTSASFYLPDDKDEVTVINVQANEQ